MKAWLEGFTPPRKPHHENEDAAVVMSTTSCSEVVLRQGGLGVMKIYVEGICMCVRHIRLGPPEAYKKSCPLNPELGRSSAATTTALSSTWCAQGCFHRLIFSTTSPVPPPGTDGRWSIWHHLRRTSHLAESQRANGAPQPVDDIEAQCEADRRLELR